MFPGITSSFPPSKLQVSGPHYMLSPGNTVYGMCESRWRREGSCRTTLMPSAADFHGDINITITKPAKDPKISAINPYPGRGNDKVPFHSTHPLPDVFHPKRLVMWLWCVCVVNKACRQPPSPFSPFPAPIQRPGQTGSKRRERRRRRNEAEFERNDDGSPPRAYLIL